MDDGWFSTVPIVYTRCYTTDDRMPWFQMPDMQSHRLSFQQTNEAGDAETLQREIDLMDVRFCHINSRILCFWTLSFALNSV